MGSVIPREALIFPSLLPLKTFWGFWVLGKGRGSYRYVAFISSFKASPCSPPFVYWEEGRALLLKLFIKGESKGRRSSWDQDTGWSTADCVKMSHPGQVRIGWEGFFLHPLAC